MRQADSNYSAYVPDLSGCVATGSTIEEIESHLEERSMGSDTIIFSASVLSTRCSARLFERAQGFVRQVSDGYGCHGKRSVE
jgi:hypothetical protein